jgi:hypothetical protein
MAAKTLPTAESPANITAITNRHSRQRPVDQKRAARQEARQRQRRARPCSAPQIRDAQMLATRRVGAAPQVTAPKVKPALARPRCTTVIGTTDAFQPKTALSGFPPVHRADLEGQERVEVTRSPSRRRMTAVCAKLTAGVDAAVDVAAGGKTPVHLGAMASPRRRTPRFAHASNALRPTLV